MVNNKKPKNKIDEACADAVSAATKALSAALCKFSAILSFAAAASESPAVSSALACDFRFSMFIRSLS